MSLNTVSRWIKHAIRAAYEAAESDTNLLQLHKVKAHDVRAMSASLAFLRSVALDDIMAAASWSSHTTFTSHYLRDLSVQSDDLFRLGPLVVAKQVVQAPVRAAPWRH